LLSLPGFYEGYTPGVIGACLDLHKGRVTSSGDSGVYYN